MEGKLLLCKQTNQGDAECEEHGNCCPDFQQHCNKQMEQIKDTNFGSGTSCAIIGCGKFLAGKPCTLATLGYEKDVDIDWNDENWEAKEGKWR